MEKEIEKLIDALFRHSEAYEQLLDSERGQQALYEFIHKEMEFAAMVEIISESIADGKDMTDSIAAAKDPRNLKSRIKNIAKKVAKTLFQKINNILGSVISGGLTKP